MTILVAIVFLLLGGPAVAGEGWRAIDPGPPDGYEVGPGDVLQVQVYGEDGLTGPFPVNDKGVVDFPLLGTVQVGGMTPNQVAALLRDRLGNGFIVEPEVTVWVDTYGSQPVQVLGAVDKPGVYYVRGPTTVLQILSEAGGVSREGVNEVRITRGGEGEVIVLPYEPLVVSGAGDIAIEGGDVVFVPESLVYVMGQVVKPGSVAYREGLTVTRCLAAAGGAAPTANLRKVHTLRDDARIPINVRRILKGQEADVLVKPGDQIFVQQSIF